MPGFFSWAFENPAPGAAPPPGDGLFFPLPPAAKPLEEPDADPAAVLELAATCLQKCRPADMTAYRLNQSAQALAGSFQRLIASSAVPDRQKVALATRLGEMALRTMPGPDAEAAASELAGAVLRTGECLSGCLPGTAHALMQAKSDAAYLMGAAADKPDGRPPGFNRIAVEALRLVRQANALGRAPGPNAPILESLRSVAGTLLGIAANAGGEEMAVPVRQAVVALLLSFAGVLGSETPLARASAEMAARLHAFTHALRQATGGSHGMQHGLVSLMHDLGTLGAAIQDRLSGARPARVTVH